MNSAFLVFNLVGGDACFQCERNARRFVHPTPFAFRLADAGSVLSQNFSRSSEQGIERTQRISQWTLFRLEFHDRNAGDQFNVEFPGRLGFALFRFPFTPDLPNSWQSKLNVNGLQVHG